VRISTLDNQVATAIPDAAVAARLVDQPATSAKPLWRGWLHLVWFEVSLVLGTVLVIDVPAHQRGPAAIYAAAVSALFGTSALYHRGSWRAPVHRLMQRLDHAMIFLLIAGTATPVFATVVHGRAQLALLATVWTVTGVALFTHMIWMHAPELVVGSTYVGLGCFGTVALPAVWHRAGVGACVLFAAGGACYIAGAVLYHRRRPDPSPTVFGFHEVFHAFVCAGATLHYVVIACLIL
jgi:hemolysin III